MHAIWRISVFTFIIFLAAIFWLVGKPIEAMGRNPKAALGGMDPPGAAPVVRAWSKGSAWSLGKARWYMGRYIQNRNPTLYNNIRGLFE